MAGDDLHVLAECLSNYPADFWVFVAQNPGASSDDSDVGPHGREEVAKLASDVARPDDEQALGQFLEIQK